METNTAPIDTAEISPKRLERMSQVIKTRYRNDMILPFIIIVVWFCRNNYSTELDEIFIGFGSFFTIFAIAISIIKNKQGKKAIYIYKYSIGTDEVTLFLISRQSQKSVVSIPISSIKKVKYRDQWDWNNPNRVWFHFSDHLEWYYFLEDWLGERFYENIPVEKI